MGGRRPLWALPADTDLSVMETFPRPTLIGGTSGVWTASRWGLCSLSQRDNPLGRPGRGECRLLRAISIFGSVCEMWSRCGPVSHRLETTSSRSTNSPCPHQWRRKLERSREPRQLPQGSTTGQGQSKIPVSQLPLSCTSQVSTLSQSVV